MAAEEREVELTNLDQPLFDGAEASKRDLVEYLEAVQGPLLERLRGRPLSVIRALRGRKPFMQKNVPRYLPAWVETVTIWAEASKRDVTYALCDDWPTLKWFANQRAIEYHPTLVRLDEAGGARQTELVLDLDPPEGSPFSAVVEVALLVRRALEEAGLAGAVKTSGAKGLHVVVPLAAGSDGEQVAAATRALAARAERLDPAVATTAYVLAERGGRVFVDATRSGGATLVAAYSLRLRPGATVSFPVTWDQLGEVDPSQFTIHTVPGLIGDDDPWSELLPAPQRLPRELVEEGREIPVARVAAMHEGKRRKRARESGEG